MNPIQINPILILRTEIVCLILLVYLAFISRSFRMGKDGKVFNLIMSFAMVHVIMDAVTVWTVNHQGTTLPAVNDTLHIIFYMSAVLFSAEVLVYVANLCRPRDTQKIRLAADTLAAVYFLLVVAGVLQIRYDPFEGTYASVGSAPITGFTLCFLFFACAIVMILTSRQRVGKNLRMLLLPMLFLLIAVEVIQIFVKEFLFTGATITVITVGFFFSLENPAAVLEKKIMMDALSGLGSRSSYEHDMQEYDAEFMKRRSADFTFVFIDINNLRSINGLYGHQEGDAYIGRMAAMLVNNMRNAEHIYRMGGDEFLAIYRKKDEKTVVRDIQRVHDSCGREEEEAGYRPELAIGYAVSDSKYNNLRDVLRVADYMMYRNKTALKREVAEGTSHENGTRLNLYGLTDRVFDAMCLTSEEFYPYMTNMETDVTRVAPNMAEYFGLDSEFIQDFQRVWMDKVHPADREAAEQDVRATIKGMKDYHFCKYRVMGKDGTYVDVTCRGGLYHGRDGEPDIFSGYIVNHGAPPTRDEVTGLRNERALVERITEAVENGEQLTAVRLEVRNLSRAQMLYGEMEAAGMVRTLASICSRAVKDRGEAFLGTDNGFVLVLPDTGKTETEEIIGQIRETCTGGVMAVNKVVPVSLTAGAVTLPAENLKSAADTRSAMLYIMEEARFSGRKEILYYSQDSAGMREEDAVLLRQVHQDCLNDHGRFFLRYQPIIDAQSGKVAAAEALLRYESRDAGEVPPGRFISFLESDPGYTELGYSILRGAVRYAAQIRKKLPEFNINVNITALQLYEENFIERVKQILQEENYPASHLILELTERCKEMEFDFLKQRVTELRDAGLRVALDDMGTGYSTIDLLLHLDTNEIKLDMLFTRHMQENENDPAFAEMLAKMTAENGMLLCFEGVETAELRDYLKRYGNVLLQGYLFDKPLKAEEFAEKYCQ